MSVYQAQPPSAGRTPTGRTPNDVAHKSLADARANRRPLTDSFSPLRVGQMQQHVVAVVDDDPAMRDAVETLVTAFGLYAEVYASGAGFLKAAAESEAACLVLDTGLEDMTGIELARRLAAMGFNFPIVFIAGSDDEGLRREAEALGFVAYLRKPFAAFHLMEALEKIFGDNF